ncbi:hypothetical protein GCM10010405_31950 [Streptomyces macrosporus]|uniref:Uncharacterized protein n=1 Tax=Streptomyces macrosporus TaxID=44032 RepID=A0ABN3K3Z5_9ACTN
MGEKSHHRLAFRVPVGDGGAAPNPGPSPWGNPVLKTARSPVTESKTSPRGEAVSARPPRVGWEDPRAGTVRRWDGRVVDWITTLLCSLVPAKGKKSSANCKI